MRSPAPPPCDRINFRFRFDDESSARRAGGRLLYEDAIDIRVRRSDDGSWSVEATCLYPAWALGAADRACDAFAAGAGGLYVGHQPER